MKKSFKGIYRPTNPKKYVGNPNNIVYRSLLERRFMVYCDTNPGIVQWASEELPIRYYNPIDKKYHRYFVDMKITFNDNKTLLVEIKPKRETLNNLKVTILYINHDYETRDGLSSTLVALWEDLFNYIGVTNYEIIKQLDIE